MTRMPDAANVAKDYVVDPLTTYITSSYAKTIVSQIDGALAEGHRVIVDMSHVAMLTSFCCRQLIRARKSGEVVFEGMSDQVSAAFKYWEEHLEE